jgi:hypothetical protein
MDVQQCFPADPVGVSADCGAARVVAEQPYYLACDGRSIREAHQHTAILRQQFRRMPIAQAVCFAVIAQLIGMCGAEYVGAAR